MDGFQAFRGRDGNVEGGTSIRATEGKGVGTVITYGNFCHSTKVYFGDFSISNHSCVSGKI